MSIEARGITKTFGSFTALTDVSLTVPSGALVALLGPSGSGKTSLLRIIAGLEKPDAGTIRFHGEDATAREARDRRVGFVFQHYALFRRMSVFENVAFGLRVRPRDQRPSEDAIGRRVMDLLSLVQLDWLRDRLPSELSGGQRQRVALARALAVEPKVLLLDEPFGSLDAKVRLELRRWLRRLHDTIHLTSLFVTHDQEEALEVADRVALMNHGRIEQEGAPQELFDKPASLFVMDFLGAVNAFAEPAPGGYARPWEIDLFRKDEGGGLWATLDRLGLAGAVCRLELSRETGPPLKAEISRERYESLHPSPGDRLYVRPRQLQVFSA